jgi:hypothetical protein
MKAVRVWSLVLVTSAALPLWADTVELANGERLQGKVLSLDAQKLEIESESLGKLTVPREKVAAIALGDRKLPAAAAPAPIGAGTAPAAPSLTGELERLLGGAKGGGTPAPQSLEEILKQLQGEGTTPEQLGNLKDMKDLQKAMPLLANPDVQAYFNKTVGGLMTGKLSVEDVRQEAIRVRQELKEAVKDLGPETEQAVGMYLRILDHFIQDAAPKSKSGDSETRP